MNLGIVDRLRACAVVFACALPTLAGVAAAQTPSVAPYPAVTVSAAATATVANDHLQALLRAEAENASATAAASEVNGAIAKALARTKATPAVRMATAGYSTVQVSDKGKPSRWRVVQTITVDSEDFALAATLITQLQETDGLLLSGMSFSISEKARRQAEETLMRQAIRSWQERAQQAVNALGFASWRTGHVTVQTSDATRPFPMLRSAAPAAAYGGGAPVAVEGGSTDVVVNVSGEALLDQPRPPTR